MACHSLIGHLIVNRQAVQVILINVLGLSIISALHSESCKYFDISFSEKSTLIPGHAMESSVMQTGTLGLKGQPH